MNDDRYLGTSATFDWSKVNWVGLFFLVLGVAWLGNSMHWFTFDWSMLGPLALIFTSIIILIPRR